MSFLLFGIGGCEKDNDNEIIQLEYLKCPCDHDAIFIKSISVNKLLLFDSNKTSFSEMQELSLNGKSSEFICYSAESESATYYFFRSIDILSSNSVGYICNFPTSSKKWDIPHNGLYVSFSADVFEACHGYPSIGFSTIYTDNILTSLNIYK